MGPLIATGDGAQIYSPFYSLLWVALPQCHIYKDILPPLEWTESVTFFHPATCSSVYIPGEPGKAFDLVLILVHSVNNNPASAL